MRIMCVQKSFNRVFFNIWLTYLYSDYSITGRPLIEYANDQIRTTNIRCSNNYIINIRSTNLKSNKKISVDYLLNEYYSINVRSLIEYPLYSVAEIPTIIYLYTYILVYKWNSSNQVPNFTPLEATLPGCQITE